MYKIFLRFALLVLATPLLLVAQPEFASLDRAFAAQRAKAYEAAVAAFQEAASAAPLRADIRKNLAYTLLKVGENESARDQFRRAMELDPADQSVALEYAFLTYEAKNDQVPNKALARRIFDKVRHLGNATAEQAFQTIDLPLAQGIARWTQALQIGPESFSAHHELAELAEQRDELPMAAAHYLRAWQLAPARKSVLIELARVRTALSEPQEAIAALLAASRGGEPRAAERARELLPARYPYVYEFRQAVLLDPTNAALHRELAYLLLAMSDPEAEKEFQTIVKSTPKDLLSAAQLSLLYSSRREGAAAMANRSLQAGFLKDALHYLTIAHESDPANYALMLKLGWTYNMLHDDKSAVEYFDMASKSSDPAISSEAAEASDNLKPSLELIRTTAWILPSYSTRWKDLFAYGQIKTELNVGNKWFRPYLSTRLIADTRPTDGAQPLSERSFILAVGMSTQWRRFTSWAEAGSAIGYTSGSMKPDYRGGVSWARRWETETKFFLETNADEVFISRFGNDWLSYAQSRVGYRWFVMNANLTADTSRQHWANFVEAGPGIRVHIPSSPKNLLFSVNYLRGLYLVRDGVPQHNTFSDVRIGFWYAITK